MNPESRREERKLQQQLTEKDKDTLIRELQIRVVELELAEKETDYNVTSLKQQNRKLQKIIESEPIILEEDYLRTIQTLLFRVDHYRKKLVKGARNRMVCSFCGGVKKKMTMWWNMGTGELLMLCFHGCQHFPDPFRDTEAAENGQWIRIDPWQEHVRRQPRLKKGHAMQKMKIIQMPLQQKKLGST